METVVEAVVDACDFWWLIDQIAHASCTFLANRDALLEAYVKGNLYTLRVIETDELYKDFELRERLACLYQCSPSRLLIPSFCVVERTQGAGDTKCSMLWVAEAFRRQGCGSQFVTNLQIKSAGRILPGSEEFWGVACVGCTLDEPLD